ncbi:MAG: hypothetical protein EXR83_07195 [Gammaproteobacteria bacterium]|nr:hypothetical protein [Gammaproteobacteria bacterium]
MGARSLQERGLLLGAAVLVLLWVWDEWLFKPLEQRRGELLTQVATLSDDLRQLDALTVAWQVSANADPDAAARAHLAALAEALARASGTVAAKSGRMVAPAQMPAVLKDMLGHFRDLEFLSLEGLGAEPIVPASKDSPAAGAGPAPVAKTVFRHGMRIRFRGSFLAATDYLKALEALPFGFFWDRVELRATARSPTVEGTLIIYTISPVNGWIGV